MKIIDIIKSEHLALSFEVFPPKTETSFESVKKATEEIAKLKPAFMSVTYGAGGGTSKYTLDIAKNIERTYGVPTLEHLTCVSSSRETVHERIQEIKEAGIQNIMALRGDIPKDLIGADRSQNSRKQIRTSVLEELVIRKFIQKVPIKKKISNGSKKK